MSTPSYDRLDGQVALVTGAPRGIGCAIADTLLDRGATVYAGARDTEDVDSALAPDPETSVRLLPAVVSFTTAP